MNDLELLKTLSRIETLSEDGLTAFIEYSDDFLLKKFALKVRSNRLRAKVDAIRFKKPDEDNYQKMMDQINIDI